MILFRPPRTITMSKPFPIRTFLRSPSFTVVLFAGFLQVLCFCGLANRAHADEDSPADASAQAAKGDSPANGDPAANDDSGTDPAASPQYPLMVAVDGDTIYTVDLDLPGVWKTTGEGRELFFAGSKLLRKAMNRPRPITLHPEGGIIVGDSASREIYHIQAGDTEGKPLNNGFLGIPMALTVSPDGKMLYVGDAERRATFRLPIDGVAEGEPPELVARVNARGLAFADDTTLYAATPDADAVVKINVTDGEITPVITDRPYQYVNGMVWAGDHGYVCDIYSKAIWKFAPDGKTEKWVEGDPLVGPVGMAIDDDAVYVADPKQKQVYRIDRKSKAISEEF